MTEGKLLLSTRVLRLLSDAEELREFILQYEFFAPLILFLFQLLQVIIAPIPGNVTIFIGGSLFGAWYGLLINTLSVYLGSLVAFYLGRRFGKPLILRLVDEETYRKYNRFFEKNTWQFYSCSFFSLFPDDALCLLAGISSIPLKTFLFLLIIGRFPSIFTGTLMGSGLLELSVREWFIIAILFILGLILILVYGKKIEEWLYKRIVRTEVNEEIE
jgi:Uncharacterized conserved protein